MSEERIDRGPLAWEPVAAVACFIGAVLSLAIGFIFTTHWLLDDHLHPLLHAVGLVLLVIGIPIIILGGHFMDVREEKLRHSRKI